MLDMLDMLTADREDVSLVVIKALRDELETRCFMAERSVLLLPGVKMTGSMTDNREVLVRAGPLDGATPFDVSLDGSDFKPQIRCALNLKVSRSDFLTVFAARTHGFFFTRRPGVLPSFPNEHVHASLLVVALP